MREDIHTKLKLLGLSAPEAEVYLALVRDGGPVSASAVATETGLPRTNVYPILSSLINKGIVEAEAGYGNPFTAVRPRDALRSLIARAREDFLEHEILARDLTDHLESMAEPKENSHLNGEQIHVFRDSRVAAERFERLQLEAEGQ